MTGGKETGCTDLALDVEDCDCVLSARYMARGTMDVPRLAMALVLPVRGRERAEGKQRGINSGGWSMASSNRVTITISHVYLVIPLSQLWYQTLVRSLPDISSHHSMHDLASRSDAYPLHVH